jgi:hypothetical protein
MNKYQWLLVVRFMYWSIILLNRASRTPNHEGNWTLEYDLDKLLQSLKEIG